MIYLDDTLNKKKEILYLHRYHPLKIEGKKNKRASDQSRMIRNVKKNELADLQHFTRLLDSILTDETTIIIPMPSSNPNKMDTGIEMLVSHLCDETNRIDGRGMLYRETDISVDNKASPAEKRRQRQAKRDVEVQLRSLALRSDAPSLLKGNRVLVLDDVVTTGASLEAMRRLIEPLQPEQLAFLVLGRAYNDHNFCGNANLPDQFDNYYCKLAPRYYSEEKS